MLGLLAAPGGSGMRCCLVLDGAFCGCLMRSGAGVGAACGAVYLRPSGCTRVGRIEANIIQMANMFLIFRETAGLVYKL